jgi:hypothetical protein
MFMIFLFKIFIFRPFCRPCTLPPGAAIPFAPPSYATDWRPQTSGNCCKSCSDSLIRLISVGHIHDILNVISQDKVFGHQVWWPQRQRPDFTSHLSGHTAKLRSCYGTSSWSWKFSARWLWCTKWQVSDRWSLRSRPITRVSVHLLPNNSDLLDSQLWVFVYCSLSAQAGVEWLASRPVCLVLQEIILGTLTGILRLKCDGTRAETRFRLSAKRTSPFKSAGASFQSTTGSRGVRISGSNVGWYAMFRGSVKSTGYPLHPPVFPSLPHPCVAVCHHISTGLYQPGGGGGDQSQTLSVPSAGIESHFCGRLFTTVTQLSGTYNSPVHYFTSSSFTKLK